MSSEEWYNQKIVQLQDKNSRLDVLNDIKNQLHNKTPEIDIVTNLLNSSELFSILNESKERNSEESDLILNILSICMSTLTLEQNNNYISILQQSLSCPNPKLQSLALQKISSYLKHNPDLNCLDSDIIMSIIDNCLDQNDTSVGALTIEILSRTLISCFRAEIPNIKSKLWKRCENRYSEVIRCRVYEIAINLAKQSSCVLNEIEPILDKMLMELETHDVLLQLNILELLVSLAEQNHGLVYLENKQVFENISKRVEQRSNNPLDTIVIPGFMKFFGKIAYSQPQKIISGYPNMIQCLFDCILSGDISILPTAFDTLGNLAHSCQGKILLEENYSERLAECFQQFAVYLKNLPTDLKIREFNALEIIFKTEGQISEQISNITKNWYQHIAESTDLRLLLEFCKNPFPDIKTACLSFIKVICEYQWGIVALKDTAGFVEYLLDRRIEFSQDALYIKFEIIKTLSETTVFDIQTILQLKKYIEEGVQYVESIVEIAVEGS